MYIFFKDVLNFIIGIQLIQFAVLLFINIWALVHFVKHDSREKRKKKKWCSITMETRLM